jgi:hypothetical protein
VTDTDTPTTPPTDHELLQRIADDIATIREREAGYRPSGWTRDKPGPTAAEYRFVSLFWTRVIGWIIVAWAVVTVATGLYVAYQLDRFDDAVEEAFEDTNVTENDGESSEYADCMADDETTVEECEELL